MIIIWKSTTRMVSKTRMLSTKNKRLVALDWTSAVADVEWLVVGAAISIEVALLSEAVRREDFVHQKSL
jgi:hypothetical protein